jgi:tetratricopeptide (TPR) repeat protein
MRCAVVALLGCLTAGAAWAQARGPAAEVCMIDAGALAAADARELPIGPYRGPGASPVPRAQRMFEQGLVYGWGFNFPEAVRSFRAAVLADRDCALCRWGIAWALGPSINHDMPRENLPAALDAIVQARVYAPPAGRERALIDALAVRYAPGATDDRRAADYAAAMRELAQRFADDADIAALAAEAIMNAHPYDYWQRDGRPRRWTPEIERLLERALAIAPDHPAAHHYRIHLYEDSPQPQRALDSAARLPDVSPGLGHLLHMPSHLYLRLGRYHEVVLANRAASQADRDYLAAVGANPDYAAGYVPHNLHFLWVGALWSGESQVAQLAASELAILATRLDSAAGTTQHFLAAPWLTDLRFARHDAVLARALPPLNDRPYLAGLIHFAHGIAHAARGDGVAGQAALARLAAASQAATVAELSVRNTNAAGDLLEVGRALLAAHLAASRGDRAAAIRQARAAVSAEDRLQPDEPAAWQFPARHTLGRLLLAAARPDQARAVYRQDLKRHPENAMALEGLAAAEAALGRAAQSERYRQRAADAWRHADVPLPLTQAVSAVR